MPRNRMPHPWKRLHHPISGFGVVVMAPVGGVGVVEEWEELVAPIWLPPRELTYPTLGRGKSSSNMPYQGNMLIPWRVYRLALNISGVVPYFVTSNFADLLALCTFCSGLYRGSLLRNIFPYLGWEMGKQHAEVPYETLSCEAILAHLRKTTWKAFVFRKLCSWSRISSSNCVGYNSPCSQQEFDVVRRVFGSFINVTWCVGMQPFCCRYPDSRCWTMVPNHVFLQFSLSSLKMYW